MLPTHEATDQRKENHMIRFILCVIVVVGFLILSIPILFVEWIIGKFNPPLKDRSSLAIVNWAFRMVLRLSGVSVTYIGEDRIPKDTPVLYVGNHRQLFRYRYDLCPCAPHHRLYFQGRIFEDSSAFQLDEKPALPVP